MYPRRHGMAGPFSLRPGKSSPTAGLESCSADMNETTQRQLFEILIFEVGGQRFGLPVADVQEIVRAVPLLQLPGTPVGIEGVINVRGSVVPVLDIRRQFHLPARPLEYTDHLVIARVTDRLVALRVDRATDLIRLPSADVQDLQGLSGGAPATRI